MTTIAYKDGIVAADTHTTSGNLISPDSGISKIRRLDDGTIIAGSGLLHSVIEFMDWYEAGADQDHVPDLSECDILVIEPEPEGWAVFNYCYNAVALPVLEDFVALGSGRELAIGAMAAGSSAREAVKIASKYDTGTGNKVVTHKCKMMR